MGDLKSPPLLTVELLARGWQWYDVALYRVTEEIARLKGIPYFSFEHYFFVASGLIVIGALSYRSPHGLDYTLRVRIEYPGNFPDAVPLIFDHDHIFETGAAGHLFPDWRLCLTFPARKEFQLGGADLSEQVLGASLIWLDKRLIFERSGKKNWPGLAEPHGFLAPWLILILEQFGLLNNSLFIEWVVWLAQSKHPPNVEGMCPCNSGRSVRYCHLSAVRQIYAIVKSA